MKQFLHFLSAMLCVTLISSCNKKDDIGENAFFGTEIKMGNGTARSRVEIDNSGIPQQVGIEMSADVFDNLPHTETEFNFDLPQQAKDKTPFTHMVVNWNPHGHMPNHVYDVPHFDFHFYTISVAERMLIPDYAMDPTCFNNNPPAGFLPPNYVSPPGGSEPRMGKHWVDITSPELNGQPFTKTFIYGTCNGKVNFYEPMVTFDAMKAGFGFSNSYPQPQLFGQPGKYYPTKYNSYKANGNVYVTLSEFVLR